MASAAHQPTFVTFPTYQPLPLIPDLSSPQPTPHPPISSSTNTDIQRHYISATQAQGVIAAASSAAATIVPQNIAIVDPSGLLVAFLRMDNAYPGSIDISTKKARTSVLFNGITSSSLYNSSQPGGALYGESIFLTCFLCFGGYSERGGVAVAVAVAAWAGSRNLYFLLRLCFSDEFV